MDEISVKGKTYLKAKVVARELGYTNDYVGQLCRAQKVDAELVGRTWYVDPDSIKGHKKTRYRSSKVSTHRELQQEVQRNLQEKSERTRRAETVHLNGAGKKQVSYSADETELMPLTTSQPSKGRSTKLEVGLADAKKIKVSAKGEKDTNFVAPEREKTKFFGTLRVTDFITEVPVSGEDGDDPQTVQVFGAGEIERESEPREPEPDEAQHISITSVEESEPERPVMQAANSVAVEGDEEIVTLPIFYRIAPASAAVAGLAVAALLLGLETNLVATSEAVSATYAFVAKNVSALLFVAN